ncbi:RNA polymerase sigma factor SigZ [Curvivirga sp.]|uniref:RNA polymerase sigma factor SigZ n=1 Tax=Curvivirga sp. TaxID=2856848 RepID=UPI003B5B62E9
MDVEQIWYEYKSHLTSFLRSKVANPDDVEDLLQDILLKTHANIGTIKSEDSLKPWLFQIANNAIIDFYRKNGRGAELISDDLWYGDEKEETVQQELAQCIEPFINALDMNEAKLMKEVELEGASQKEYAANHDIAYSTLKSRVQKGRKDLKQLFVDCCNFSKDHQGNIADYLPKKDNCKKC